MKNKNETRRQTVDVSLENKTILVVPGSFGIGFEAARVFADKGARLVLGGENERNAERALELLAKTHPETEVIFVPVRLSEENDFERAVERGVERFGAIDGALICPDHFEPGLLHEIDVETLDLAIARNVRSAHFLIRHLAPALMAGGGGSIVVLSSMYARISGSTSAAYEISKGMAAALVRSYGEIYAPTGVRVNAILPGHYVLPERGFENEHPLFEPAEVEQALVIAAQYPIGRFAKAEEIAEAAAWLLSDASSYVLAEELLMDGALTRR